MTGRSDEAERWLAGVFMELKADVDRMIAQLVAQPLAPDADAAVVDRRARMVANVARAARYVADLTVRKAPREDGRNEDSMSEKDFDDIDPAELARIRAELESRMDRLATAIEQKRLDDRAVAGRGGAGPCGLEGDAGPAAA